MSFVLLTMPVMCGVSPAIAIGNPHTGARGNPHSGTKANQVGPSYQLGRPFVYRHLRAATPNKDIVWVHLPWSVRAKGQLANDCQEHGRNPLPQLDARAPHLSGEVRGSNEQANILRRYCGISTLSQLPDTSSSVKKFIHHPTFRRKCDCLDSGWPREYICASC